MEICYNRINYLTGKEEFPMRDGFVKIACATPALKVADCDYNTEQIISLIRQASDKGVKIVCFPELCITGYTCGDLFLQRALVDAAEDSLLRIARETADSEIISIVGLPYFHDKLYNCAAVVYKGGILGIVPKVNLPNYSEFYEARHFAQGGGYSYTLEIGGKDVPFGIDQSFACNDLPDLHFGVEICEDLWVSESPSVKLAKNGAVIIFNLSCSDEIIGKAEYRKMLVKAKSGELVCAYAYADAGIGESTQDMVFAGHNLICENGSVLAESKLFSDGLTIADVDIDLLQHERQRMTTWLPVQKNDDTWDYYINWFDMDVTETKLDRKIYPHPFVPSDKVVLDGRCEEILAIQSVGLATRLRHIGCKTAVVGLSGGLDSTLALIVMRHAFDRLGLDPKGMIAVTMPCFGTTDRTYNNALKLAAAYGATLREIDIKKSVRQHFEDIGHDESVHDVTYENGQARERTQILMDIANQCGGIVIGTGDLSELALGWATYNGDHMSMYGVNVSIPKTLVRYLVAYEASHADGTLHDVLCDVLDTPVSPELLPPDENGQIAQKTEDLVGPYELHDFFLYYHVRLGFTPGKIFRLARLAFANVYDPRTIMKWLKKFYWRFFSQQFKRSCLPDGPKVGSVTLSPRGDWRMPSDASVRLWIGELEEIEKTNDWDN